MKYGNFIARGDNKLTAKERKAIIKLIQDEGFYVLSESEGHAPFGSYPNHITHFVVCCKDFSEQAYFSFKDSNKTEYSIPNRFTVEVHKQTGELENGQPGPEFQYASRPCSLGGWYRRYRCRTKNNFPRLIGMDAYTYGTELEELQISRNLKILSIYLHAKDTKIYE